MRLIDAVNLRCNNQLQSSFKSTRKQTERLLQEGEGRPRSSSRRENLYPTNNANDVSQRQEILVVMGVCFRSARSRFNISKRAREVLEARNITLLGKRPPHHRQPWFYTECEVANGLVTYATNGFRRRIMAGVQIQLWDFQSGSYTLEMLQSIFNRNYMYTLHTQLLFKYQMVTHVMPY